MAKYWELKYHDDITEKHKITNEEIEFLKEIQKEMNTQDNVGQADPKYWVIRDYEKIYGESMNNPDGFTVYDSDACTTVCDIEYVVFGNHDDMVNKVLEALDAYGFSLTEEDKEEITGSYDFETLVDALKELDFTVSEYEEYAVEKGFFLTNKDAQDHLRSNNYHYGEQAHTYAHTAWRSYEEKLWDILQKVDFDLMKEV